MFVFVWYGVCGTGCVEFSPRTVVLEEVGEHEAHPLVHEGVRRVGQQERLCVCVFVGGCQFSSGARM